MADVRAVLFDIDGTLVDSNELHVRAWREVFAAAGHECDDDAIRREIGKGGDKLVPDLLPNIDEDEQEALAEAHGKRFKAEYLAAAKLFPGAHDLLAATKARGWCVVLASSASGEELDHYVGLLDATALVDFGTSSDDVEESKPAPDIFATALKRANVAAENALVVGDTPYDADAARKLGITTIGLLSGGNDADVLREAGATILYQDAADLLAHLDQSPIGSRKE